LRMGQDGRLVALNLERIVAGMRDPT